MKATATKDLLSIADLDAGEVSLLLDLALSMKRGGSEPRLAGKVLGMLFEKPSLRTRVSFEVAMYQLGGHALSLNQSEVGLGKREAVSDVAQVLSRLVQGIMVRTFAQDTVQELAKHATVPVINGLTDHEHPCQALSDLLTVYERRGQVKGLSLAYVGDANNVARSLMFACALTGMEFRIAAPPRYAFPTADIEHARELAGVARAGIMLGHDPAAAVRGADVVYTDVWTSMGQEAEAEVRRRDFQGFQVTPALLEIAGPQAIFLHPLPAHYGEEIAPGLLEHPQSAVFDQAENRLHMQKAVLVYLMGSGRGIAI